MHDAQHPTTDDAAAAIRDALPTPDVAATERIAQLIADGAPTAQPAASARAARRRSPRRQFGVLRPALAAGAIAVAGAVALLAPGGDPSSPERGLLELGPDVAAAEALSVAGDAAARADWSPLRAGEYHHTRTVFSGDGQRLNVSTEYWLAADGSGHVRVSQEPAYVPAGSRFYVPANACVDITSMAPTATPTLEVGPTLQAGTEPPNCWLDHPLNPMLATATGPIVENPPEGALVELPHALGMSTQTMRFGTEVFEGTDPQPVPPGQMSPTGTPEEPIEGAFTPFQLPPATTWVEVEARPVLIEDFDVSGDQARLGLAPGMPTWTRTYSIDELGDLPSEPAALLAELRREAAEVNPPVPFVPDGVTFATPSARNRIDPDTPTLQLALDILASAPVSPRVRQAGFEALAQLKLEGKPATVVDDATFPDGRPAFAIDFSAEPPPGYEYPGSAGDVARMLFDPETAAFRGTVRESGTSRITISHDEPKRVTDIPDFDAD